MTRRATSPLLVFLALAGAASPQEGDFRFSADVRLVNLLVSVQDAAGAPIGGLSVENFQVIDGGERRDIAVFERRTDRPLSVALLIDTSLSTGVELEFERASAHRFAENLFGAGSHPLDRLAVFSFSEGVDMLADFTNSPKTIRRALDRIRPQSGTSLYDAVLLASEQLEFREGRRVIIIITDGGDTTSYSSYRQAMDAAYEADVVIYSLIVKPVKSDAGRNTGGEHALRTFAANTGGVSFVEYGESALDRAFGEILDNLRTQYLLGYYPPAHDDPKNRFRRVEARVDIPEAKVLTRAGYFVPDDSKVAPRSAAPDRYDPDAGPRRWKRVDDQPTTSPPAETAKPETIP